MKFPCRVACSTLVALGLAGAAKADPLYWDFSFSGNGVVGSGELVTTDTVDPNAPLPGAFDILSVEGTVNGDAITGVLGASGAAAYSQDGFFIYDNDFYAAGSASAAGGYFDDDGLLFSVGGTSYNLFFDGSSYWDWADQGGGVVVSFTASDPPPPAVPEPSSGLALATALGASLLLLRRKLVPDRAGVTTPR
jgi:hypothetical protein